MQFRWRTLKATTRHSPSCARSQLARAHQASSLRPQKRMCGSLARCRTTRSSLPSPTATALYFVRPLFDIFTVQRSHKFTCTGGHTNTERGYLPRLAKRLRKQLTEEAAQVDAEEAQALTALEVYVSEKDEHPLQVV